MVNDNRAYLGTRTGVYSIDLTTNGWSKFIDPDNTAYQELDNQLIVKETDLYNEPIVSMSVVETTTHGSVLAVATNNRVIFKKLSNGITKSFTVWDGMCFTTEKSKINSRVYNPSDFSVLGMAPVKVILADDDNQRVWIGTAFGINHILYSDLF